MALGRARPAPRGGSAAPFPARGLLLEDLHPSSVRVGTRRASDPPRDRGRAPAGRQADGAKPVRAVHVDLLVVGGGVAGLAAATEAAAAGSRVTGSLRRCPRALLDQSEPDIDWPMLEPNFRFPLHNFNESGHYNAARHPRIEFHRRAGDKSCMCKQPLSTTPRSRPRGSSAWPSKIQRGLADDIVGSGTLRAPTRRPGHPTITRATSTSRACAIRRSPITSTTPRSSPRSPRWRASAPRAMSARGCRASRRWASAALDVTPDVTFVLNHGAHRTKPASPSLSRSASRARRQLAERPNLACKVSGFALGDKQWTV